MIDLVSTRTVDHQTRACARLLAAVISQAVTDAALPFGTVKIKDAMVRELAAEKNLNPIARSAIRWLFFPDSTFPAYASLIGLTAQSIRRNLLDNRYEDNALLSTQQRRVIRIRLEFEQKNGGPFVENVNADELEFQQDSAGSGSRKGPRERRADMARESNRSRRKVPKSLRE